MRERGAHREFEGQQTAGMGTGADGRGGRFEIRTAVRKVRPLAKRVVGAVAIAALAVAPVISSSRTQLKPGWNIFTPQQDVEIGRRVSADAERQLPMLNHAQVDGYLNNLGKRLAGVAPGEKFPYQFKAVNDSAINAFALPGGFMYVNRGVIEAADNEAQLAGVMAHEIGHVALRHGTNQATKANFAQLPLAILGGVLGSDSVGALLAQLGAGFAVNSVLLKYSRDAERQSDILATQILYDTGYDPRAMSQFFEKLQAERGRGRQIEFFSSHPNPENRAEVVTGEIGKLGGLPPNFKRDSAEFREIQRVLRSLPPPPKRGAGPSGGRGTGSGRPAAPSSRYQTFENAGMRIVYPDNWKAYAQGSAASFAPEGGIRQDRQGHPAMAYGVMINLFEPQADRWGQVTLENATNELIEELRHSNPQLRVARRAEAVRLGGVRALSTYLSNESPLGGREYDWLVTLMRPEGLLYVVCVAPENEFGGYERAFQTMVESLRLRN